MQIFCLSDKMLEMKDLTKFSGFFLPVDCISLSQDGNISRHMISSHFSHSFILN